ncbi:hypothetical protein CkaCkLH20_12261 [Colletotrichum karsti]|uniref:Uncharacterized protein n=1 Tax=Colletotrichum karsti TaxID=1095194 RepID=A0A9P6HSZ3_9PEZI|nr:uncharacterized protein CkaCkLH20_12261 [Colletotrichum karsti]KAF9870297.1 hypothetical protein CkaCkLH20_12261 [Colletotrichum karsti]
MPRKGGAKSSAATSLDQLLRDFTAAFEASQEKLAEAYDNLASGYKQYQSKLPKTRPRVPFAQWTTTNIDAPVLLRVLEAKFGSCWTSLPKSEQTRRLQAVKALELQHPLELFLWFGAAAVRSREAWLGIDALDVTAPTFFSEVLAVRADRHRRPRHYLTNEFTPSEIISAKKQLAERLQQKSEEAEQSVGESEVTDDESDRRSETDHTQPDKSSTSIAPTSDGDSQGGDSNDRETQSKTAGQNQSRETYFSRTSPSSPTGDDDSRQKTYGASTGYFRTRDQEEEDDLVRYSPSPLNAQSPSQMAMTGTVDTGSGAGMGATASRMRSRTGAASMEDSGIGMNDSDVEETEQEVGKADKSSDHRDETDTETSRQKRKEAETVPATDVAALEEIFKKGLEQVVGAKVYIARQEDDESEAMQDSAVLKSNMIEIKERMVARAAELLRAAEGSEEEWVSHSQGDLRAGDWEKGLIQAGCQKRKRTEDAATSRAKRVKAETCVRKIALQVYEASQTLEELQRICEKD